MGCNTSKESLQQAVEEAKEDVKEAAKDAKQAAKDVIRDLIHEETKSNGVYFHMNKIRIIRFIIIVKLEF